MSPGPSGVHLSGCGASAAVLGGWWSGRVYWASGNGIWRWVVQTRRRRGSGTGRNGHLVSRDQPTKAIPARKATPSGGRGLATGTVMDGRRARIAMGRFAQKAWSGDGFGWG